MTPTHSASRSVALISLPWALFNRPSIQLGCLKSYLEAADDWQVDSYHPYLDIAREIGPAAYTTLAEKNWAGDALFAALLFPGQYTTAQKLFRQELGRSAKELPGFDDLLHRLQQTCDNWLARIPWQGYLLAGFTCCFNQLLPSLYMAARLKEQGHNLPVVVGGSSCCGPLGTSLLNSFPQIDYIIDGEGEEPLNLLCAYLAGYAPALPERVLARQQSTARQPAPEIADLNTLPIPDYAPYFREMKQLFAHLPFIPTLPLEFSRGCWWNKCAFCNLNLQWQTYRHKSAAVVVREVEQLSASHQCLDFTFADNALPPAEADRFFQAMQTSGSDRQFFAEIRGISQPKRLHTYRSGGLTTVQVGIEALSNSLLQKMAKGCSVIDNIYMLKQCLAQGIVLEGNLILEFPTSTVAEVQETLDNLDFVLPFHPLSTASFFLGHGSPVHCHPRDYGIQGLLPHRKNRALFPPGILQKLDLLVGEYRGDRSHQRRLWRPVRKKMAAWRRFHQNRTAQTSHCLSYRDGATFLIIRQEQPGGAAVLHHRLQGLSRKIYLFCETIRAIDEILAHFAGLKEASLRPFISDLCQKRLMYQENDRVLSLAVQAVRPRIHSSQ